MNTRNLPINELSNVTEVDDDVMAACMLMQQANLVTDYSEKGIPSAAAFQQGVKILGPRGEFAGSAARGKYADELLRVEENEIGATRNWLTRLIGKKAAHPLIQQSIDWIEAYGDKTSTAVQLLLSDLYAGIGEPTKARETYQQALRMHRETQPEIPLIE